jgi:hypothetical protein
VPKRRQRFAEDLQHHRLRLPDGKAPDRIALEVHRRESFGRADAQIRLVSALHDAEHCLSLLVTESLCGPFGPAQRQLHGPLDLGALRRQADALVELHLDVAVEKVLDLDRALRRQRMRGTVDMGAEGDARLVELAKVGERHDLEAAGIGQDRMWPAGELV